VQITPISSTTPVAATELAQETTGTGPAVANADASFGDLFTQMVKNASQTDAVAAQKMDALARGVNDDLHGTMIAVKEADISVKLVASIRNKLLDAFNEIWKTSV
jgi:flagellar hook-basal body complex protein FliE